MLGVRRQGALRKIEKYHHGLELFGLELAHETA